MSGITGFQSNGLFIYALTGTPTIYATQCQCEDMAGASNQAPSEYVSVGVLAAPYHGANVDGTKYFGTTNRNSIGAGNVVTETPGNPIPGSVLLGHFTEGARVNLTPNSIPRVGTWGTSNGIGITDAFYVAPDGLKTAAKFTASAASGNHYSPTIGGSTTTIADGFTNSIYLKYDNHRWALLWLSDGVTNWFGSFDLLNGAKGAVTAGAQSFMSALPNGWYRCSVTATVAAGNANYLVVGMNNADVANFVGWTALGTEAMGVWMGQIERGYFASSPILTDGAAAARNGDAFNYVSTGNLPEKNLTVLFEYTRPAGWAAGSVPTHSPLQFGNYAGDASLNVGGYSTGNLTTSYVINIIGAWPNVWTIINGHPTQAIQGALTRFGMILGANGIDTAVTLNGLAPNHVNASVAKVTNWTPPKMVIGADGGSEPSQSCYIRNLKIYPVAFSDAELQAATGPSSIKTFNGVAIEDVKTILGVNA